MSPSEAIAALVASGLTETAIALTAKTTQPTINKIRRGAMKPNYEVGKALVDMAEALPDNPQAEAA